MMTRSDRPEGVDIAVLLFSSGLSFFAHNIFIYTMVILSRSVSDSDAVTGALFFVTFLPVIFLSLVGGVVADQRSRRAILAITQLCISGVALLAVLLLRAGAVSQGDPYPLFLVAVLYGVVASFVPSTRLSLVGNLARGRTAERVVIGMNVLQFVGLGLGPGIAGHLRTYGSWPLLFAVVAGLCLLSGLLVLPLRERYPQVITGKGDTLGPLKAGFRYVRDDRALTELLGVIGIIGLCMFGTVQVLLPEFGRSVLHLGEEERGLFMSPFGFGLLFGGAAAGALVPLTRRGLLVLINTGLAGLAFLALGAARTVTQAGGLLLLVGVFGGLATALLTASINSRATDEYRGRIMSILSWLITGTAAAGGALFGGVARWTSVPLSTHAAGALASLLVLFAILRWDALRQLTNSAVRS